MSKEWVVNEWLVSCFIIYGIYVWCVLPRRLAATIVMATVAVQSGRSQLTASVFDRGDDCYADGQRPGLSCMLWFTCLSASLELSVALCIPHQITVTREHVNTITYCLSLTDSLVVYTEGRDFLSVLELILTTWMSPLRDWLLCDSCIVCSLSPSCHDNVSLSMISKVSK